MTGFHQARRKSLLLEEDDLVNVEGWRARSCLLYNPSSLKKGSGVCGLKHWKVEKQLYLARLSSRRECVREALFPYLPRFLFAPGVALMLCGWYGAKEASRSTWPCKLTVMSVGLLSPGITPDSCVHHPQWAPQRLPGGWETGEVFIMFP